jgi:hypothetical protein
MRDENQTATVGASEPQDDAAEKSVTMEAADRRPPVNEWAGGRGPARRPVGEDDPYGSEAHEEPPPGYPVFNPSYLCVLFIDFRPDWTMSVNHASYPFQPDPDPEVSKVRRLEKAIAVIDGKLAVPGRDLADVPGHPPYAWQNPPPAHQQGRTRDSTYLEDFKFKSATEIFIFLNNDNLQVGPDDRLIRFTRYGKAGRQGAPMNWNFSFFRARQVVGPALGVLAGRGKLLRLENHARVDLMTTTDMRAQKYSLNLRIGVPGGEAGIIPLFIDPDTGNGTGNEP